MCLRSKQSSLFTFYALPSGGKSKDVVVHYSGIVLISTQLPVQVKVCSHGDRQQGHNDLLPFTVAYNQISVTRLGNLLHFGQPFKAGGNNCFTQIANIVRQFL